MKSIILAASLFFSLSSMADTFVYTQVYTETITGYGSVQVNKWTGYFLFNTSGGLIEINASPKTKTFVIHDLSNLTWKIYSPSVGTGSAMVIAVQPSADFGMYYAKGIAAPVNVGTPVSPIIAKTMLFKGSATFVDGSNQVLTESNGKLTFDLADTFAYVSDPIGLQDARDFLAIKLQNAGYTEVVN